jgi:outer membrane biosynthesis protein TonB
MLGIGKLLGRNKKSDYYLELGEGKGSEAASPQPESKPEPQPEAPVAEAPAVEKTEAPQAEPTPKVAAKKELKAKGKAKAKAKAKAKTLAAPAAPVQPKVATEPPPLNQGLNPTPAGMTFATDYLLPKPTASRRRPGPNMNLFKDMARKVSPR